MMLILAPAACSLASIGVAELGYALFNTGVLTRSSTRNFGGDSSHDDSTSSSTEINECKSGRRDVQRYPALIMIPGVLGTGLLFTIFVQHCIYAARDQYSATGIVVTAARQSGATFGERRPFFDDFREAYAWMRLNTDEDSRIAAWWDYGYQITGMANRTTFSDGNTWNYSHIAIIGKALISTEPTAYKILRKLGATHVLAVCGCKAGLQNDDIGKYLWPVRVGMSIACTTCGLLIIHVGSATAC